MRRNSRLAWNNSMDNIFLFGGAVIVTLVLWLLTARLVRKLYLMFREEARSKLRRESPRVENNELPC